MLLNDCEGGGFEPHGRPGWISSHAALPFFALKVVTDIVDGDKPTHEEFMANLQTAASSLQSSLVATLDYLVGKSLEEL